MEGLDGVTIIAVIALLTGLGIVFNMLLVPVKKDIAKLEDGQAKMFADIENLKAGQAKILALLEKKQAG